MKKSVLALAMAFGVTSAFAQDLTSKKGEPILPEAGDWSIGIDATPFLNYAGQLLSNAGASAPTWNHYGLQQTIVGKMFKDEKTAYRGILQIGLNNRTYRGMVTKPLASTAVVNYPTVAEQVEDVAKVGQTFIGLGGGIEMRRGKTRLQGYYGGDAFLWFASSKAKFEYGNALTQGATTDPNVNTSDSYDFTTNSDYAAFTSAWQAGGLANTGVSDGAVGGNTGRLISWKGGSTIGIGIRGFIGAEYFILPKISIGGEFGWGLGFYTQGAWKKTVESEGFVSGNETKAEVETEGAKSSGLILNTDRNAANGASYSFTPSGSLRLNLHF